MNHKARLAKLEAAQPQPPEVNTKISDEEYFRSMKALAEVIADEAKRQGLTAAEIPALELPLLIAEVLRHDKP